MMMMMIGWLSQASSSSSSPSSSFSPPAVLFPRLRRLRCRRRRCPARTGRRTRGGRQATRAFSKVSHILIRPSSGATPHYILCIFHLFSILPVTHIDPLALSSSALISSVRLYRTISLPYPFSFFFWFHRSFFFCPTFKRKWRRESQTWFGVTSTSRTQNESFCSLASTVKKLRQKMRGRVMTDYKGRFRERQTKENQSDAYTTFVLVCCSARRCVPSNDSSFVLLHFVTLPAQFRRTTCQTMTSLIWARPLLLSARLACPYCLFIRLVSGRLLREDGIILVRMYLPRSLDISKVDHFRRRLKMEKLQIFHIRPFVSIWSHSILFHFLLTPCNFHHSFQFTLLDFCSLFPFHEFHSFTHSPLSSRPGFKFTPFFGLPFDSSLLPEQFRAEANQFRHFAASGADWLHSARSHFFPSAGFSISALRI